MSVTDGTDANATSGVEGRGVPPHVLAAGDVMHVSTADIRQYGAGAALLLSLMRGGPVRHDVDMLAEKSGLTKSGVRGALITLVLSRAVEVEAGWIAVVR